MSLQILPTASAVNMAEAVTNRPAEMRKTGALNVTAIPINNIAQPKLETATREEFTASAEALVGFMEVSPGWMPTTRRVEKLGMNNTQ